MIKTHFLMFRNWKHKKWLPRWEQQAWYLCRMSSTQQTWPSDVRVPGLFPRIIQLHALKARIAQSSFFLSILRVFYGVLCTTVFLFTDFPVVHTSGNETEETVKISAHTSACSLLCLGLFHSSSGSQWLCLQIWWRSRDTLMTTTVIMSGHLIWNDVLKCEIVIVHFRPQQVPLVRSKLKRSSLWKT